MGTLDLEVSYWPRLTRVATIGLGPLVTGPLSELYGRNIIYRVSYFLFFAFTWPVAFPPDMGE